MNCSKTDSGVRLQDRIQKAGTFFSEKLSIHFKDIIDGYIVETDNKTVRKTVAEAFDRARKDILIKLACLDAVGKAGTCGGIFQVFPYSLMR